MEVQAEDVCEKSVVYIHCLSGCTLHAHQLYTTSVCFNMYIYWYVGKIFFEDAAFIN